MGRAGPGIFDSDIAWDAASDLSPIIGIDLSSAGYPYHDMDEGDLPVLSIEDSAAHLNEGNFVRVFNLLRIGKRHYELVLFVVLSMRVGANIDERYLKYVKRTYKNISAWHHLPECRHQINVALKEFKSGEPYKLKDFDFGDDPPPNSDSEVNVW
ncbi:hypothetical protein H2198_003208 [Neophaeococcomyces mojaviensis]|uniref:Uncharacterized protein n=1 Tax=Neophaeococcomyces mojaviensis TaxID=3383035 RepID=A0ACC3ACP6_9EURO|nr:hypothetical protein H2198_003208 [Knufia sp. JES_112]